MSWEGIAGGTGARGSGDGGVEVAELFIMVGRTNSHGFSGENYTKLQYLSNMMLF